MFNVRATSSRRSEVVSSHALSLLLEYSASSICPLGSHGHVTAPSSSLRSPKGTLARLWIESEPAWKPSSRLPPAVKLRRTTQQVSSLLSASVKAPYELRCSPRGSEEPSAEPPTYPKTPRDLGASQREPASTPSESLSANLRPDAPPRRARQPIVRAHPDSRRDPPSNLGPVSAIRRPL